MRWDVRTFIGVLCVSVAEGLDRHVARTGDIKDFVITEESGIAKGIRRIIAVTGHEAADVTRTADTLEARLVSAENATGKAKDAALKTLQVELGQADISLIRKNALRDRLTSVRKAFDKEVKERETKAQKEAVESVATFFKEKPEEEAYFALSRWDRCVLSSSSFASGGR